jgi:hypothetical protein
MFTDHSLVTIWQLSKIIRQRTSFHPFLIENGIPWIAKGNILPNASIDNPGLLCNVGNRAMNDYISFDFPEFSKNRLEER